MAASFAAMEATTHTVMRHTPRGPVENVTPDRPERTMDVAAYNRCVEAHSDALFSFVLHNLRDRDEAKDIVQESFLKLWMKVDQVRLANTRAYLFTMARNLIVDRARRRRFSARYESRHDDALTTHQPTTGVKDALDEALARLSPVQRSLVLLRDLEGRSYDEIAKITGLDLTKVKVYLFRARKAMQAYLVDPALVA